MKEISNETIEKISGKNSHNYGKKFSEDHRAKISKSNMGKKLSPESIRKRTETRKRNYELKNQIKQLEEII